MIKNERAYRITRAAAEKFRTSIAEAERAGPPKGATAQKHELVIGGMRQQLAELEGDLRAYDQLKNAKKAKKLNGQLTDIGTLLISARIARGWTQRQVADRLAMKPQQLQQLEATAYEAAGLPTVRDVARVLGLKLQLTGTLIAFSDNEDPLTMLKRHTAAPARR
jgi:HTH-type transcriptional regulator/antitoxin HigA